MLKERSCVEELRGMEGAGGRPTFGGGACTAAAVCFRRWLLLLSFGISQADPSPYARCLPEQRKPPHHPKSSRTIPFLPACDDDLERDGYYHGYDSTGCC